MTNLANSSKLNSGNTIACVWDFDKTLLRGYMQEPLFKHYNIDSVSFWKEVNRLPEFYEKKGIKVSSDTIYLNHLLTYVRYGKMRGLSNAFLRELGSKLKLADGLPDFFDELKEIPHSNKDYEKYSINLEHYIVSTGLAEMIRGCAIADKVDGIFGCEFIEEPLAPDFTVQDELDLQNKSTQISQIGTMVDNTIKTRFIFEINKGTNKNPDIDVNTKIEDNDRRVPIKNMIYIADGPSDIPSFSVVKNKGGLCFGIYDEDIDKEYEQNDKLLSARRIDNYGPCDYSKNSTTSKWLKMKVKTICDKIMEEQKRILEERTSSPAKHISSSK